MICLTNTPGVCLRLHLGDPAFIRSPTFNRASKYGEQKNADYSWVSVFCPPQSRYFFQDECLPNSADFCWSSTADFTNTDKTHTGVRNRGIQQQILLPVGWSFSSKLMARKKRKEKKKRISHFLTFPAQELLSFVPVVWTLWSWEWFTVEAPFIYAQM